MEIKAGLRISRPPCGCQYRVANLGLGQELTFFWLISVAIGESTAESG
jgi:hypothetical protein